MARGSVDIVTLADRPDLVPTVAEWLWQAFWAHKGASIEAVRTLVEASNSRLGPPLGLVLLDAGVPVGTASLVAHDLDERPDLTPWLGGLYVMPEARRRGHGLALVSAVEDTARRASIEHLWLYTSTAEQLYRSAGWQTVDTITRGPIDSSIMRRDLRPAHRIRRA